MGWDLDIIDTSNNKTPLTGFFQFFLLSLWRFWRASAHRLKILYTMDLFDTVSNDIKSAMLARQKVRLEALRGIKKEFLEAKTAPGANGVLSDSDAIKILVRMAKQRRESAAIYAENNRPELAENELAEMAVIEEYLPKALSPDELKANLAEIISRVGAAGPKDMGKVMGVATKELAGRADGKAVSAMVRQMLAQL